MELEITVTQDQWVLEQVTKMAEVLAVAVEQVETGSTVQQAVAVEQVEQEEMLSKLEDVTELVHQDILEDMVLVQGLLLEELDIIIAGHLGWALEVRVEMDFMD